MYLKDLARRDLNLLVTLQVLLEERNVTAAAERLFLTQPAISKALARLRENFADPLFTRSSRGLVPTPFALGLQDQLSEVLLDISDLFLPEAFDPASFRGDFAISVNEFLELTLMPLVAGSLNSEAPGIRLTSRSQVENQLAALEKGDLDVVINLQFSDISQDFDTDLLFSDRPSIFARSAHPLHKLKNVSPDELLIYDRVDLQLPDMEHYKVYQQSQLRLNWPVGYTTHNLIAALTVVANSDYLLPGPSVLQGFASPYMDFARVEGLPNVPYAINYQLVMHKRVRQSAVHQWLRKRILAIAGGMDLLPGKPDEQSVAQAEA